MLYDIGFLIFSIIYLPTLIFKGKLHGDFGERFANYGSQKTNALTAGRDVIWIQAVSVGEVAVCKSLVPLLKERFPASTIVMSTITKTGNDLAKKLFSGQATIVYFPLDFSFVVKKAVRIIRPKLYVMIETEIWPNLLAELSRHAIPSILVNGRISDRSIGKYRVVKSFLKRTLAQIKAFCMQSKTDAERIIELGAPSDRVRVTGNMKFDIGIVTDTRNTQNIRASLGLGDKDRLYVAGSTHPGEEEAVVRAFSALRGEFADVRLLLAPRHIERAGEVEEIVKSHGFEPVRFSTLDERRFTLHERQILILDKIGFLNDAYAVAELVFIGGSLIKHGGQNPIEPAIFEKAVIFGPHMFNFKAIANLFVEKKAGMQVVDERELFERSAYLLRNDIERVQMGRAAKKVVLESRGATERNVEAMAGLIGKAEG